jgi:ubiquinone/menaquinone biosynthesis C-methylase UbiE
MLKTGHDLSDEEIVKRYEKLDHRGGLGKEFNYRVVKLAGDISKKKILDAGCGHGELLKYIKYIKEGWECQLFGVDMVKERLDQADSIEGIEIRYSNIQENIPFDNNFFDMAFSTEVIEHLKDPQAFLKELRRVTKNDGKIVLTIPNGSAFFPFYYIAPYVPIRRFKEIFLPYEHPLITDQPIDTCYYYNEILEIIKKSGLSIIKIIGWRYFRYCFAFPVIRIIYPKIYPAIEKIMPFIKGERFAYNLMFLCKN